MRRRKLIDADDANAAASEMIQRRAAHAAESDDDRVKMRDGHFSSPIPTCPRARG